MTDPVPDPLAQLDQAMRAMKDVARITYKVYVEQKEAGFTSEEAFELAKAWFVTTVSIAQSEE